MNCLRTNGITVRDGYASNVSFATSSKRMKRYTHLYIVDPKNEESTLMNISPKENILYECSKFICLAGNVELANEIKYCSKDLNNRIEKLCSFCDEKEGVLGSFEGFMENNEKIQIVFGLSRQLVEYLKSDKDEIMQFQEYTEGNVEYFADGSYIRMNF